MTNSFCSSPAYLLTSESVTEGHPDKVCDQISDAVLDAILEKDPYGRVACETATTTGVILVLGEITTDCYVEIPKIVRKVVHDIGYTRPEYGFDYHSCGVMVSINEQSTDIALGVVAAAWVYNVLDAALSGPNIDGLAKQFTASVRPDHSGRGARLELAMAF